MKKIVNYQGIRLTYNLFPGKNLSKLELYELHQNILDMNCESGKNLKYGIFDPDKPWSFKKEFYDQILLVTMHSEQGENIGFFYNYLIPINEQDKLVHMGLVLIAKNPGVDLILTPYLYANNIIYEYLQKEYYASSITAAPLIVGIITDMFESVWPSIHANDQRFPPKNYQQMAQLLYEAYAKKYFPEGTIFDKRRFVLRSPLKEMGFGINMREMPRHPVLLHNLLTHSWLDLTQGEDMIQVGRMTQRQYESNIRFLKNANFIILQEEKNEN
jgi:hypothetical protein